ncbi:methyl-accepting chemotaxis protein [Chamaesiphon sp.]|uniref:methyl-accepting chemotaxis protein n=1 Tax=Chamaesiphon sp. TaxID=2814140 RepID=UPI0035942ACE
MGNIISNFIQLRSKDIQTMVDLPIFSNSAISKNLTLASQAEIFNIYVDRYRYYDSLTLMDLNGKVIVASRGSLDNDANRDYFQATLKTEKPQISKVEVSRTTKQASIYFTALVREADTEKVIGVIQARMPLTTLKDITPPSAFNQSEWRLINKNTNKFVLADRKKDLDFGVSGIDSYQQLKDSDKSFTNTEQDRVTGDRKLVSVANITGGEKLTNVNLAIATFKDLKIIQDKENSVLVVLLLGMLGTGGITVGLVLFFGSRITKFIQRTIATITTSANEIVDTVQTQEIAVNEQANSAIATTDTINELESISTETAAQASASADGARQALSLAEAGTQAVQKTIHEMSDLRERVDEIAAQITNLGAQTGQITTVSDLVSDLAKQTNMLALKAAVEAARAGEQGKGFGVVAGEIRKLADESKKSAQKINNLATNIQAAIDRTVITTERGTKTVTDGIQLAENTAVTFHGVTDAVNNVFLNSQQISASTKRQATAIQQVLGAMSTISESSQESAVGMHKVKTSTRELNLIADELQAAVS